MSNSCRLLALVAVISGMTACMAVDIGAIEAVRNKPVLDPADLQLIDRFVSGAIAQLGQADDFTSIAKIRTVILSSRSSGKPSASVQYARQFSESSYRHLSEAMEKALLLQPPERRFKTLLNLMILADKLEDPALADLSMKMLNNDSPVIRYWAVRSLTNPAVTQRLAAAGDVGNPAMLKAITVRLTAMAQAASAESLTLMLRFAGDVKTPEADELLTSIADSRIQGYAQGTVKAELFDAEILKVLFDKAVAPVGGSNQAFAVRFVHLYSYAMQRYIRELSGLGLPVSEDRQRLASILVEIENCCLGKLMGLQQTVIKRAIEQEDADALEKEELRLFGDGTNPGRLIQELGIEASVTEKLLLTLPEQQGRGGLAG